MAHSRKKKPSEAKRSPRLSATTAEEYRRSLLQIARHIGAALEAKACSIFIEREPGKYTLEASTGLLQASVHNQTHLAYYQSGEGLTGWVAKHGKALRIGNVGNAAELEALASDLRWQGKYAEKPSSQEQAFLAAPIVLNSYVLGVVRVIGRERPFTEADKEQLVSLTNDLATQLPRWPQLLRSLPTGLRQAEKSKKSTERDERPYLGATPPSVFISYAYADRGRARRLAQELERTGVPVWLDRWQLRVGDSLRERIQEALSTRGYLLVLLSPASVRSNWVRNEWSTAFREELTARAITVIPILLADCEVPVEPASRQIVDLRSQFDVRVREFAEKFAVVSQVDISAMNEVELTALVQEILVALGFHDVRVSHGPAERGFDIEARLRPADPFTTDDEQWLVEVKSYKSGRADLKTITQMFALVDFWPREAKGLIVTNGQLTSVARSWFDSAAQREGRHVRLLDGTDLREILLRHPEIGRRRVQ